MMLLGRKSVSGCEPIWRTIDTMFVEPDSQPRMPTVITPSSTLAIPSVMISGLTFITPMAVPLIRPTTSPTVRARRIATKAPRSLWVAAT